MRKLLGWWCSLPNSPSAMVVDAMGMLIDTTPIGIDGIDMKKHSTFLIPSLSRGSLSVKPAKGLLLKSFSAREDPGCREIHKTDLTCRFI